MGNFAYYSKKIMELIYSYITVNYTENSVNNLCTWLESAHAAFAIDSKNKGLIIFNINGEFLIRFISLFPIADWVFSTEKPGIEHEGLFRFVNYCFYENLIAYETCFGKDPLPISPDMEAVNITRMKRAFSADNYSAWRMRFYLTRNIRAIDTNTQEYIPIDAGNERAIASGLIAGHAREYWQYSNYYPDADITASLRIDPDKEKAMIGWFVDNDYFMEYNIDHNAMKQLTDRMKEWLSELNITNNAHTPEDVDDILGVLDIDPHEIEQQYHLSSHAPKNLLTKSRHIHSFVIIGSDKLPDPLIRIIGEKYAHAYDHEKCRTIIFNIDQKQLLYILGNDCITRLYYSPRKLADEYIQLFAYVDNQLEINIAKHQTTGHYISSANAYIREQMNISNLKGVDANNLPKQK